MEEQPKSVNEGRFKVGQYIVTCAGWNGGCGYSYELGIRDTQVDHRDPRHFQLVQSRKFYKHNIKYMGALAAKMLEKGVHPTDIAGVFDGAERLEEDGD